MKSSLFDFLPWILVLAIWVRIWLKHRRIDPLLAELRRCNRELESALDRGDMEAAARWIERFEEIRELVKPMIDQRF